MQHKQQEQPLRQRPRIGLWIVLAVAVSALASSIKILQHNFFSGRYIVAIDFTPPTIKNNQSLVMSVAAFNNDSHHGEEEKESFSACLLWMDDNHRLVEW